MAFTVCGEFMSAIEFGYIFLLDGQYVQYLLPGQRDEYIEISYCPFCGRELINYEKDAMKNAGERLE